MINIFLKNFSPQSGSTTGEGTPATPSASKLANGETRKKSSKSKKSKDTAAKSGTQNLKVAKGKILKGMVNLESLVV